MDRIRSAGPLERGALTRWAAAAVAVVLFGAAANWIGWSTGIEELTKVSSSWPPMTPWTAVLLAGLGAAILLQSGRAARPRALAGCWVAAAAGVVAVLFLVEHVAGSSLGLDQVWFSEAVHRLETTWPGRPSPHAASSLLLLSLAVALVRLDRRWARAVWPLSAVAASAVPALTVLAYLFDAALLVEMTGSTGMGITTALSLLLLVAATAVVRPDDNPVARLLARPDRRTLIRMGGILAGLPILVALSRSVFQTLGLRGDQLWLLAIAVGTLIAAAATFYLSQRETSVQLEKDQIGRQNAAAEARYRLLAENAVDVISHLRGNEMVWVSPSVEAVFGWPPEQWIGTDLTHRVHPDDLRTVFGALKQIDHGKPVRARFRIATADGGYHWVDGHGKPCVDSNGDSDGVVVALRVIDEQVQAEQQLRTEKERFEAVVRNAPSAISVLDSQRRYTLVNEAFCQLFGQESVEDVVGRTEGEILPPDVLQRSRVTSVRLLDEADSIPTVLDEETIQRGSETISVMTQCFALPKADGDSELATIRTDISHRKIIELKAAGRARWEERIGAAIVDGRLLVYSQPIVDITTREPVEEELLVRLRAIETAEVQSPSLFLPQCERHGLMPMIDRYMVGRAIEVARTGRHVTVNITGQTIGDASAIRDILEPLTAAGPEVTQKIAFEITETTALASPARARAFSLSMRRLGCGVALDDFGTGYGTFTELRNLDLQMLKIDQGFVRSILEDLEDERVVSTIVGVAHAYGLTTVAEGVESEAVLEKLAQLGVDRVQGNLFGKPMPVDL